MGKKLVVGPFTKGLRNDLTQFNIDNDSFPQLLNAYQWRGRVKRKRGTSLLNRLKRYFSSASTAYITSPTSFVLVAGAGNLITAFSLPTNSSIVPGTVTFTDVTAGNVYTDNSLGVLTGAPGGTGTINYSSGAITVAGGAGNTINTVSFSYYPTLPVMGGTRDFQNTLGAFPDYLTFDTTKSYNVDKVFPYNIYDISFYKNPSSSGTYTQKSVWTPLKWNGQDYQQFWTVNYSDALWATNGINVPFTTTNVGMQFIAAAKITSATQASGTTVDFVIPADPTVNLVVGDFVFANEFTGTSKDTINFQTGYVTTIVGTTYTITFPNAAIGAAGLIPGILQCLTNNSDSTKDCIRWYDGLPVSGSNPPVFTVGRGWVNFCPPLSKAVYSIGNRPAAQWYLVSARLILPFKDRLLFFGPVIQNSSAGSQVYLEDTVIYSQNGTPFYTASFQGPPENPTSITPLLVPRLNTPSPPSNNSAGQVAAPSAYFADFPGGFGGFQSVGIDQPINTVSSNEDSLVLGMSTNQVRMVFTGNDVIPFNFFLITSELGSASTFAAINFDEGIISSGTRGFIVTSQTQSQRIDPLVPDQIFEFNLRGNGAERVTAQRDFIKEWIYFTYKPNTKTDHIYPAQTIMYNYRDKSWAIFNESYTSYGQFQKQTGFTWATVGTVFSTWGKWNQPWNAGSSTLEQPIVVGGNQQGFLIARDTGTEESVSLSIQNIVGNLVTSPNHELENNDFIVISDCIGMSNCNGRIYKVYDITSSTFKITTLDQTLPTGTYLGGGLIKRMYIPFIQTKQFPAAWDLARKTRLGVQQYLLSYTDKGQCTLVISLSQDDDNAYNEQADNGAVIYSTVLYTCVESTNLGLTAANTNLQMIADINETTPLATATPQKQIWHRFNTSLIGDTVQVAITFNEAQMFDPNFGQQFEELELHGFILDLSPAGFLA